MLRSAQESDGSMIFKVRRFDPSTQKQRYTGYDVRVKPGMTVLRALMQIHDRIDDTLAFRFSCRGAVCGSCAMLINKVPRLACRAQVKALLQDGERVDLARYPAIAPDPQWKPKDEILIEPLPHLHVIKDLVVDMRRFFQFYRTIRPTLRPPSDQPRREMRLDAVKARELEKYTNCVLCAACHGACPVVARNPDYLGPAALAKLYRFAIDPREVQDESRLLTADNPNGWWACEFFSNCEKVCPKGLMPNLAIGSARRKLKEGTREAAGGATPGGAGAGGAAAVGDRESSAATRETAPDDGTRSQPWAEAFWLHGA